MIKTMKKSSLTMALLACFGTVSAAEPELQHSRLSSDAEILYNSTKIPVVKAANEEDAAFLTGYVHAKDRLFQMDFLRKVGQGRIAELVGPSVISSDIQFRTLGFERWAKRSYAAASAKTQGILQAYADGVNAYVAKHGLPPEYQGLELNKIDPWTALDSVAIGKVLAFNLSSDMEEIDHTVAIKTFQTVGKLAGFDGTALFMKDLYRAAPPDDRVSVPNFLSSIGGSDATTENKSINSDSSFDISDAQLDLLKQIKNSWDSSEILRSFKREHSDKGSNIWAVASSKTENGLPLIANDPHLSLGYPSVFYPLHVNTEDGTNVGGVSFPGVPMLAQGCNNKLCWGSTVHPIDETDFFFEKFTTNLFGLPTHTIYKGKKEPVVLVFQTYLANSIGDGHMNHLKNQNIGYTSGGLTILVPRRDYGAILNLDMKNNIAISMQYTGSGPTQEIESFMDMGRADSIDAFRTALTKFDVGSQNFVVADVSGNIAYFTSGEVPIREDLQTMMKPDGVPPMFVRDGSGERANEWLTKQNHDLNQATNSEIIPFEQMPHVINPDTGYIANANNDPIGVSLDNNLLNQVRPGGGLYYINNGVYSSYRMGKIDRLIQDKLTAGEKLNIQMMKQFQSNHQLLDAELIMPHLLNAMNRATADGAWSGLAQFTANPQFAQVKQYFTNWDYSTPTGLANGYDPGDNPTALAAPSDTEINNSVAASIYSLWRSLAIQNTIDATIDGIDGKLGSAVLGPHRPPNMLAFNAFKHLLDAFPTMKGVGASGINFFTNPAAPTPEDARDYVILASLQQALSKLAGDEFATAFNKSTDLKDYRWGKLHRITFSHTLGEALSIPNGRFGFATVEGLGGIARTGGYQVLDASSHNVRATDENGFTFNHGPARRFVSEMANDGALAEQIIPGGQSGNITTGADYVNQLPLWLVNGYMPLIIDIQSLQSTASERLSFTPKP